MSSASKPREADTGAYREEAFDEALRMIRDVLVDRDFLYEHVAKDYVGHTLDQQLGEAFAADTEKLLGWTSGAKAIRATIQYHVGEVLTERLLKRVCWQLSANEETLRKGLFLSPRLQDYAGRWMIVDVAGVDTAPSTGAYATLVFRALVGRAAGWSMRQDITKPHSYFIAGELGFYGGYKFEWYKYAGDAMQLYGLYFAAYLGEEKVERFACPPKLWAINRKIIRMRHRGNMREDGTVLDNWGMPITRKLSYGCPVGLAHECLACPRKRHVIDKASGYQPTADTCGAAY